MTAWDRLWYGPVAEVRPYLFQKLLLTLIGFDALVLMAARGGRYGIDGFNVAHFQWLDRLQVSPPDATLYTGVLIAISFLAFYLVLFGSRRPLLVLLTILYTYSWAMSRLDSYLHHYMISLILLCVIFFPATDSRQLFDDLTGEWQAAQRAGVSKQQRRDLPAGLHRGGWYFTLATVLLLALYRLGLMRDVGLVVWQRWAWMFSCFFLFACLIAIWVRRYGATTGPRRQAWAVRLLTATVGVIYIFTSLAKADSEWCSGHTLRNIGSSEFVLRPVQQVAEQFGISPDWFWAILATSVIPLETAIAVCYLLSVRQDEPQRSYVRWCCAGGWFLAMSLHLNNEMMNLIIQWFGYYMMFLATFLLLPGTILTAVAVPILWPSQACLRYFARWSRRAEAHGIVWELFGSSGAAVLAVLVAGYWIDLPGAFGACMLAIAAVTAVLLFAVVRADLACVAVRSQLATAGAALVSVVAVAQSSLQFSYHDIRGQELLVLGGNQSRPETQVALITAAIADYERATSYAAPDRPRAADSETNLALAYRQRNQAGDWEQAERHFRRAIDISSSAFLAHYNLANLLRDQQRYDEAVIDYLAAITIKPDFSDAHANLAGVYDYLGRLDGAIEHYRAAVASEPNAADLQQLLHQAEARATASPSPATAKALLPAAEGR